jgi:hypothetical protein
MNDGRDFDHPKKYIINLPKEERLVAFPDGTYILNSKNQVCLMTNGRPQFTNPENMKKVNKCSGKINILLCPEKDCVWHAKSNQCRNRKNASKKIIDEDIAQRSLYKMSPSNEGLFNHKKQKSKVVRLLNLLAQSYSNEDDFTFLTHVIKKLNKLLVKMENKNETHDFTSFSLSDYE